MKCWLGSMWTVHWFDIQQSLRRSIESLANAFKGWVGGCCWRLLGRCRSKTDRRKCLGDSSDPKHKGTDHRQNTAKSTGRGSTAASPKSSSRRLEDSSVCDGRGTSAVQIGPKWRQLEAFGARRGAFGPTSITQSAGENKANPTRPSSNFPRLRVLQRRLSSLPAFVSSRSTLGFECALSFICAVVVVHGQQPSTTTNIVCFPGPPTPAC